MVAERDVPVSGDQQWEGPGELLPMNSTARMLDEFAVPLQAASLASLSVSDDHYSQMTGKND